jgi:hypothetical protein
MRRRLVFHNQSADRCGIEPSFRIFAKGFGCVRESVEELGRLAVSRWQSPEWQQQGASCDVSCPQQDDEHSVGVNANSWVD